MCVRSIQPRLQAVVQGSIEAAAAADTNDVAPSGTRRAPAAAAIVDVSRALCGLACSFLALHPDAHFSEDGCRELHSTLVSCLSEAQGRVVQVEQQRLLRLIAAAGVGSAADVMDWLQSQPLDLLQIVTDVASALHRCCGGCRPKQVAAMAFECVKAIAALVKKSAQHHYDCVQQQVKQSPFQRSSHSPLFPVDSSGSCARMPSPFPPNTKIPTRLLTWFLPLRHGLFFVWPFDSLQQVSQSFSALSFLYLPPLSSIALAPKVITSRLISFPLSFVQRGRSRQLQQPLLLKWRW